MDIQQLKNITFPVEIIEFMGETFIKEVIGRNKINDITIKNKEFFIPRIVLIQADPEKVAKMMWASGWYSKSQIGRFFNVSRETGRNIIRRIERNEDKICRLKWMSVNKIICLAGYQKMIKKIINEHGPRKIMNNLFFTNEEGHKIINEAMDRLKSKQCLNCGQFFNQNTHYSPVVCCSPECQNEKRKKDDKITRKLPYNPDKIPSWAKPLYDLVRINKDYQQSELIDYSGAANLTGLTKATIFRFVGRGLLKRYYLPAAKPGYHKLTAVPKEQAELLGAIHPKYKTRNIKN